MLLDKAFIRVTLELTDMLFDCWETCCHKLKCISYTSVTRYQLCFYVFYKGTAIAWRAQNMKGNCCLCVPWKDKQAENVSLCIFSWTVFFTSVCQDHNTAVYFWFKSSAHYDAFHEIREYTKLWRALAQ